MGRVKKKADGYGYKYADLSTVHEFLEEEGKSYYQFINVLSDGREQIMTKRDDMDEPIAGCIVAEAKLTGKNNPAQEHGSALTYARRYSLYMAYGLATDDDDAESLNADRGQTLTVHQQITRWCNKKCMPLQDIVKEFGLKGLTESELAPKFQEIKEKYGE